MNKTIVLVFSLLWLAAAASAGPLYRWVDEQGRVQYTDTPPPPGAKNVQQKKLTSSVIEASELPYSAQQAIKNFPVTLFSSDCGPGCTRARQLLDGRGIPFSQKDVTDANVQLTLKQLTGGELVVPVLQVGGTVLKGFEEGQWHSTLDAAGYPRTVAVPRPRSRQPAVVPAKPAEPAAEAPAEAPPAGAAPPAEAPASQ